MFCHFSWKTTEHEKSTQLNRRSAIAIHCTWHTLMLPLQLLSSENQDLRRRKKYIFYHSLAGFLVQENTFLGCLLLFIGFVPPFVLVPRHFYFRFPITYDQLSYNKPLQETPNTVGASSQCYWDEFMLLCELMLLKCELMLLKCGLMLLKSELMLLKCVS